MKNRLPKDMLKWTAAGFALVATATAEYEIARAIGMNEWIAAAVPGALDAYVVRALRTHREVLTSVVAMVGVNAASHLVTAGILPVEWPLITAVSAIAPLVLWRVHALGTPGQWRKRKLWAEHASVHASTDEEHDEHAASTETVTCDWCGWDACPANRLDTHKAHTCARRFKHTGVPDLDVPDWVNPASTAEHIACTECGVLLQGAPELEAHQKWAGHGVLGRVLDTGTPPLPVHAPYEDHVHARHLSLVKDEHTSTERVHGGFDPVHAAEHAPDPEDWTDPDREHTSTDTRTADDWDLEHVSTGVLQPEDVEHMERARELFHTIGGVPPFRALKEGTPGMGTPRATRIRAALVIEEKGTV